VKEIDAISIFSHYWLITQASKLAVQMGIFFLFMLMYINAVQKMEKVPLYKHVINSESELYHYVALRLDTLRIRVIGFGHNEIYQTIRCHSAPFTARELTIFSFFLKLRKNSPVSTQLNLLYEFRGFFRNRSLGHSKSRVKIPKKGIIHFLFRWIIGSFSGFSKALCFGSKNPKFFSTVYLRTDTYFWFSSINKYFLSVFYFHHMKYEKYWFHDGKLEILFSRK